MTQRIAIGALLLRKPRLRSRVGTAMPVDELERLWQRLRPLVVDNIPVAVPPPRSNRFGSPLVLSRVHWVRPEMVVDVTYAE